jgi:hypothetical protein
VVTAPSPAQTLGEFLEMLGERPGGWYAYPVMLATLQAKPHQWFRLDQLNARQFARLVRELQDEERYPNTYEAQRGSDGWVQVRCIPARVRVPQSPGMHEAGARSFEQDPDRYLGPPIPNVDYLVGGEHDPNLGSEPRWEDGS